MKKHPLEQLQPFFESIDLTSKSTSELSDLFKNANTQQSLHKPNSPEHTLIKKFSESVMKEIKSRRSGTSLAEHDKLTLAKMEK